MQSQQQAGDKKILDEVRDVMRLRHYSIHTERIYIDWSLGNRIEFQQ